MSGKTDDDSPVSAEGLLTAQDLFGDLVDRPGPARPAPDRASRPAPIRVRVSEPGSPRAEGLDPAAKAGPLAVEVAALLAAFPGADEPTASVAATEPPAPVEPPPSTLAAEPPVETGPPPPAAALPVDAVAPVDVPSAAPAVVPAPAAAFAPAEAGSGLEASWRELEEEGLLDAQAATSAPIVEPVPEPASVEPLLEPAGFETEFEPGEAAAQDRARFPAAAPEPEPPAPTIAPEVAKSASPLLDPQDVDQILGVMGTLRAAPGMEARYSLPSTGASVARAAEPAPPEAEPEQAPLDLAALAKDALGAEPPQPPGEPPAPPPAAGGGITWVTEATSQPGGRDDEETVYGPYRLLERVAVGGMAEVFKAKRSGVEGFEKVLAVKRILPHLSDNKEFVDMFIDEAKMVAGLSHPNIVPIYDLGKIDKSYYIAMEYVHGRDLRSILRRGKERGMRVPLDLSVLVVSKICSALDYAHRRKDDRGRPLQIVHRDISPQNILISFDGEVKLTDFGIAKAASKATNTDHGALRGKLLYMSPEQAWGRAVDRRSDIFSLGIVFYEMLAEQKPFLGTSEMSILETVRECRVAPPTQLNPRIPEKLERVVMKALSRDPDERYQDGAEMHQALERVLHERQPPTAVELARFMEILFDHELRGGARPEEGALHEGHAQVADGGGLEMEFEAALPAEPPPVQPPAKDSRSLHRLLKRFGIK